jgi:uncharacterized protein YdeI (YjbR/CyaY-like superfamily)
MPAKPIFFETPNAFRAWLESHHATNREVLVGFHRVATRRPTLSWPQSVDVALCFGWIDGVRRRIDQRRYSIRFTPRRPGSTWSAVNVRRARELIEQGLMTPAGLTAYEARAPERTGIYAYEQRKSARFDPEFEKRFRANEEAWEYFQVQPPWYRTASTWWVMSAKREATRERRMEQLIERSAQGQAVAPLSRRQA